VRKTPVRQSVVLGGRPRAAKLIGRGALGLAPMILFVVLTCMAGCGGANLTPIKGMEQFQQQVLASPQPVMIVFYKGGCPTCIALEPTLDTLADEYRGRAVLAKFEMMTPFFFTTCPELRDQYDISFYPTVLLFVNGEEKKRWIIHYDIQNYRQHLDHWVGSTTRPAAQAASRTGA
jgi:thioredoxin 1